MGFPTPLPDITINYERLKRGAIDKERFLAIHLSEMRVIHNRIKALEAEYELMKKEVQEVVKTIEGESVTFEAIGTATMVKGAEIEKVDRNEFNGLIQEFTDMGMTKLVKKLQSCIKVTKNSDALRVIFKKV